MEAIIETTMLVFNSEKYEKDRLFNENSALDLPIEKEFIEVPFTFLMKDVSSFSPDYSGDDTIDLPKSKHFVSRTFVFFSNGDSKSISISYDTFKGMFKGYHSSKDIVSFKVPNEVFKVSKLQNMTKSEPEFLVNNEIYPFDNDLLKNESQDLSMVGFVIEKFENDIFTGKCKKGVTKSLTILKAYDIMQRNIKRGVLNTFDNKYTSYIYHSQKHFGSQVLDIDRLGTKTIKLRCGEIIKCEYMQFDTVICPK